MIDGETGDMIDEETGDMIHGETGDMVHGGDRRHGTWGDRRQEDTGHEMIHGETGDKKTQDMRDDTWLHTSNVSFTPTEAILYALAAGHALKHGCCPTNSFFGVAHVVAERVIVRVVAFNAAPVDVDDVPS